MSFYKDYCFAAPRLRLFCGGAGGALVVEEEELRGGAAAGAVSGLSDITTKGGGGIIRDTVETAEGDGGSPKACFTVADFNAAA